MKAQHTPGPWQVVWLVGDADEHPTEVCTSDPNHRVAFMTSNGRLADARLIAAAPELLDALRDMLAGWNYIRQHHGDLYGVGWDRCADAARTAIAKAEGATP